MGLLLDAGAGGALRGLRDEEPDLGAVHLPEGVDVADVVDAILEAYSPPDGEDVYIHANAVTEDDRAQLLLRRRLLERTNRPARSSPPPRGRQPPN